MITDDREDQTWRPSPNRYEGVDYRRAGRSGLVLPPVSLGLWQNFGSDRPRSTARDVIRTAFDHGVTHFDLANNYGPPYGAAESTFGDVLRRDLGSHRDELIIATKAGYDMWPGPYGDGGSRKYLLASLDASLRRIGLDYVDVFYHHRRDVDTPLEETAGALAHAVRSGKALYVGVSNYDPRSIRQMAELLERSSVALTLVQPAYSLYDRLPEAGILQAAGDVGAGVAVFSPLAQGRLTDRYLDGVPADSRATRSAYLDQDDITSAVIDRARALQEIARDHGCTLAQLALRWVLRDLKVTTALVGASSSVQLRSSLGVSAVPALEPHHIDEIERWAAASGGYL